MEKRAPERTCGSCGAAVPGAAETCPACGALLAAYEAPRGAEGDPGTIAPPPVTAAPATQQLSRPTAQPEPAPATSLSAPRHAPAKADAPATPPAPPLASASKKTQPVPPRAEPAPRADPRPALPLVRDTATRPRPAPRQPRTTREIASVTGSIARLALGVLMILVVMGILDFDLIPILVLGVILLSLLGLMRSAARASGRKTTSMRDPGRRDGRRR